MLMCIVFFFSSRRRHTRLVSDWSSDVCSSDLFRRSALRSLPLVKRKALLRKVLPEAGPLRYSEHFEKDGEALYDRAVGMGLEGIVAKKADAPYTSGRSDLWQKIRADKTGDFVVVGYTAPKGSRGGFGALHVGGCADGKLVYAGRAGSGFT